jgi:ankyrin repeat protein
MARKQPKRMSRPGIDAYGRSPLHYAAANSEIELVRSLLENGSDPHARDDNGMVALHFAAQAGAASVAERLLAAGSQADARDNHGNTPLFTAVFNYRGDGAVIQLLRQAGADCCMSNCYGVSPVSLARQIANYDVARHFADIPLDVEA